MSTRITPPSLLASRRTVLENSPQAREKLLQPFLPSQTPQPTSLITHTFHRLILYLLHVIAGIYLRTRYLYHFLLSRVYAVLYYHHHTPELIRKDVKCLDRLPQHVSVVLEYRKGGGGVEGLINEVAEIGCWCASAGIPMLSVYEQTGVLKKYIATAHRLTATRLHSYFGRERPKLRIYAPHLLSSTATSSTGTEDDELADLEITFISEEDGRESLVDLTKTLCEMTQRGKMAVEDVTIEVVDAEIETLTIPEPDLLILFSPTVKLLGYPPWQIRLTEIFHVPDNDGVGYQVFLRALYKYAKVEMRFGR